MFWFPPIYVRCVQILFATHGNQIEVVFSWQMFTFGILL
jgi:hypothetical protein